MINEANKNKDVDLLKKKIEKGVKFKDCFIFAS
jgi:hypothetical protein